LLEKAYAKVYKSYQAIESGLTGVALTNLTGAPYDYLCKNSNENIDIELAWTFLTENIAQNHLVCGST
jgi:calpain-15